MADYTRTVKKYLSEEGCYFVRYGKGDHEVWFSPITNRNIIVDGSITKRTSALKTLKKAGVKKRV
ncbi:MAG: type II toxin-antitoxin system HicA family toxin [Defluviitaleaceae bacterium]|nr:type II toxin-antitoxin system HicA family toxin [Defluviitaleaceae bacterium]